MQKSFAIGAPRRQRLAMLAAFADYLPNHIAKEIKQFHCWKRALDEGSLPALQSKPHPGQSARLSSKLKEALRAILLQGPLAAGLSTDLWTLARVAQVIERHFVVSYHPGHVCYILRDMDWSPQKPERLALKRDDAAIQDWREEEWQRIQKKPANKTGVSS